TGRLVAQRALVDPLLGLPVRWGCPPVGTPIPDGRAPGLGRGGPPDLAGTPSGHAAPAARSGATPSAGASVHGATLGAATTRWPPATCTGSSTAGLVPVTSVPAALPIPGTARPATGSPASGRGPAPSIVSARHLTV